MFRKFLVPETILIELYDNYILIKKENGEKKLQYNLNSSHFLVIYKFIYIYMNFRNTFFYKKRKKSLKPYKKFVSFHITIVFRFTRMILQHPAFTMVRNFNLLKRLLS